MPWKIEPKTYETKKEKRRDFLIGFVGWWLVNQLLVPGLDTPGSSAYFAAVGVILNLGGLIYLGFARKWMAFGALAAIGFALLITLLFVAACHYALSSSY